MNLSNFGMDTITLGGSLESKLAASRTAEVAKPSMSSQPRSSATSRAAAANEVSASTPVAETAPCSSRCSARVSLRR